MACRTVDVGEGGMALASPIGRTPGQFLRVNFHLNGGSRMLDADAVLVRDSASEDEHIWGLMFQKLDPTMTRWITEFVERGAEPAPLPPRSRAPRTAKTAPTAGPPASPQRASPTPAAGTVSPRRRPTPAAGTVSPRKRPTPPGTIPASPPPPEEAATAAEPEERAAERQVSTAAKNVEPPPPARLSARRARNEEPPPPARLTSAPRSSPASGGKKSAKQRHHERMEAARSQRELVDLYREAVKNLRAEHGKKKR